MVLVCGVSDVFIQEGHPLVERCGNASDRAETGEEDTENVVYHEECVSFEVPWGYPAINIFRIRVCDVNTGIGVIETCNTGRAEVNM